MEPKYFGLTEWTCHDEARTPYPAEWVDSRWRPLALMCDVIREAWGAPLRVLSGYRTPAFNQSLRDSGHGAALHSQHMEGRAADLQPEDPADAPKLHALVLDLWRAGKLPSLGGVGSYPSFCHVDIRPHDGHLAQWSDPARDVGENA